MDLRDKYQSAIDTAKGLHMDGAAQERDGKLYFSGTVRSEDEKNAIWNALKTVPDWKSDVIADIKVRPSFAGAAGPESSKTYTVRVGDTLSRIARDFLGDETAYMAIFDANKDQLSDPNKLRPGQVLKIPEMARRRASSPSM